MKYILGRTVALMLVAAGFLAVYLGVWGFISGCNLDAGKLALHLLGGFVLGFAGGEIAAWLERDK